MEKQIHTIESSILRLQKLLTDVTESMYLLRNTIFSENSNTEEDPYDGHVKNQMDIILQWFEMIKVEIFTVDNSTGQLKVECKRKKETQHNYQDLQNNSQSEVIEINTLEDGNLAQGIFLEDTDDQPMDIFIDEAKEIHDNNVTESSASTKTDGGNDTIERPCLEQDGGNDTIERPCLEQDTEDSSRNDIVENPSFKQDTEDNIFQCMECGKILSSKVLLVIHGAKHQKKIRFPCPVCQKKFKTPEAKEKHLFDFHSCLQPFECELCQETFSEESFLLEHLQTIHAHQAEINPSYSETAEPSEFSEMVTSAESKNQPAESVTQSVDLVSNIEKSTFAVSKPAFKCTQCTKVFMTARALSKHTNYHKSALKIKKGPKRPYKCDLCEKSFIAKTYLAHHIMLHKLKRLECPEEGCEKKFYHKKLLSYHLKRFHKKIDEQNSPLFACDRCPEKFRTENAYAKHKKQHDQSDASASQYKCSHCPRFYSTVEQLSSHLNYHKRKEKDFFIKSKNPDHVCTECQKAFLTREELEEHVKVHSKENPFKCLSPGCSQAFIKENMLYNHYKKCHTDSPHFRCDLCFSTFTTRQEWQSHQRTHENSDQLMCTKCNKKYSTVDTLRKHQRKRHEGESHPYQCDVCKKKFVLASSLTSHARLHTGERPFQCEHCGDRFYSESTLKRHRRYHTGQLFYCKLCDKSFPAKHELKLHEKTHRGERSHVCDICGAAYFQSSHLNKHMTTHSQVLYRCIPCNKTFAYQSSYDDHMKRHTGEGLYECPLCERTYTTNKHLNVHIKNSHPAMVELKQEMDKVALRKPRTRRSALLASNCVVDESIGRIVKSSTASPAKYIKEEDLGQVLNREPSVTEVSDYFDGESVIDVKEEPAEFLSLEVYQ